MVIIYGAPPDTSIPWPSVPRVPETLPLAPVDGLLVPCAKCHRHIRFCTECPFCFATAVSGGESLAAMTKRAEAAEARVAELEKALAKVREAIG
jgi:hypothetical protein